jgi:hypothetical protein
MLFRAWKQEWANTKTSLREAAQLKISVVFPQGHSQGIFVLHFVNLFCVVRKVSRKYLENVIFVLFCFVCLSIPFHLLIL